MSKKPATTMLVRSYDGIGRCIYCGTAMSPELLTKEHIIPTSLAGKMVFQNAACEPCRKWSNEGYEQAALTADFLIPRLLLELKRSTSVLPLAGAGNLTMGGTLNLMLNLRQYPKVFPAVLYEVPGLLVGIDRGEALPAIQMQYCDLGIGHELLSVGGITTTTKHDWSAHTRTLAKIGYCFGIAERGWSGFVGDAIRDFIAGRRGDGLNFVGSAQEPEAVAEQLHRLSLFDQDGYLVAKVHLFASCGLRPYLVVLGRLPDASRTV